MAEKSVKSELVLKARGLFVTSDPLSEVPEGSLKQAVNVEINQNGLIEPRRGYEKLSGSLASTVNKLYPYKGSLLGHRGTSTLISYDSGAGTWSDYSGTFAAIDNSTPVRAVEANENLYFSTSTGIKKLDSVAGTVRDSGVPQGLDFTTVDDGPTGFLLNAEKVAYRVVWGYRDANNNLILGAPSQRLTHTCATSPSSNVKLKITIPAGITTSYFFQVYRTEVSSSEPDDEMGLVYEANPDSTDISNKYVEFIDETPDELRGTTLYTSQSQEGAVNANFEPPLAKDLALFKGYLFGGNTKSKHSLTINLLGIGGTLGLAVDDTITIAGTTYTGKASETIASDQFKVETAGGSPSINIATTARSLVRVINQSTSNSSVYAYYTSGVSDLPGQIRIVSRTLGSSAFTVASSNGAAWNPNLSSANTSRNDEFKNNVWYSKFQEPEAVPLLNNLRVGTASSNILKLTALRESLFIFTETGIYTLTGSDPSSFKVDLLDNTVKLIAPESVVTLQNRIYCLSDQGVVAVSETGVELISRPIETQLLEIFGKALNEVKRYSFGISYESDRKYILYLPQLSADTAPTIAYVYNTITNNWTTYDLSKKCGIVNPADDKLYLADATGTFVSKERKSFSFRDHVDEATAVTVSSVDEKVLTLSSVAGLAVGDLYYESDSVFSRIASIDGDNSTITLTDGLTYSTGSHDVLSQINVVVEWNPLLAGAPSVLKQFSELVLIANRDIANADLIFTSDISWNEETVTFTGNSVALWGLFSWGSAPWGGVSDVQPYRTYVPMAKQRGGLLRVRFEENATYNAFEISGLRLNFRIIGNRIRR